MNKLICFLFGHKWKYWYAYWDRRTCKRCSREEETYPKGWFDVIYGKSIKTLEQLKKERE